MAAPAFSLKAAPGNRGHLGRRLGRPPGQGRGSSLQAEGEVIHAAEREDLRSTTVADEFRQVAALLALARKLGWTEALAAEEDLVRDRWARLRRKYHA